MYVYILNVQHLPPHNEIYQKAPQKQNIPAEYFTIYWINITFLYYLE